MKDFRESHRMCVFCYFGFVGETESWRVRQRVYCAVRCKGFYFAVFRSISVCRSRSPRSVRLFRSVCVSCFLRFVSYIDFTSSFLCFAWLAGLVFFLYFFRLFVVCSGRGECVFAFGRPKRYTVLSCVVSY